MQCPPNPGPGVNFMKPKGFVAAASITSQTSTCKRSHMIASSFTSPILIIRKVFSRSFAISATSQVETGTIVSSAWSYQAAATSPQSSVIPPMTFGVLMVVQSSRPGSTRSGEKAKKKSSHTVNPLTDSSAGSTISRVVPG